MAVAEPGQAADPAGTPAAGGQRQGPSFNTTVDVALVKKKQVPAPRGDDDQLKDISTRTQGIDWPTFLGASRTNTSPEKGIITDWSEGKLKILWQAELGTSYGIGSISKGRYFQFDQVDDKTLVNCHNAETGKLLWQFDYATDYADLFGYDAGPRSSPIIEGNRVYLYGVEGTLLCLRASDGALVWQVDVHKQFGVVQNFFGVGSTPVIEGDLLLVMVGGSSREAQGIPPGQLDLVEGNGSGIVAFDKYTGEVKYQVSDELASYSSPVVTTIGDRRWGFMFARGGLLGFEPASGKIDFHYPWRATLLESVNAATPLVVGDEVFISETYGAGSSLLKVRPGGYDVVWKDRANSRQKAMETHWNTPIYHDGYLYGSSGRHTQNAELRCVEWKTGKVSWSIPRLTRSSLLYVDNHFISLGEYGSLILFKANPREFEPVGEYLFQDPRAQPDPLGLGSPFLLKYPCWAAPVLSHGLLYVRGSDRLLCIELVPEAGKRK
jgi:outer membrane protein assembly factor BamB